MTTLLLLLFFFSPLCTDRSRKKIGATKVLSCSDAYLGFDGRPVGQTRFARHYLCCSQRMRRRRSFPLILVPTRQPYDHPTASSFFVLFCPISRSLRGSACLTASRLGHARTGWGRAFAVLSRCLLFIISLLVVLVSNNNNFQTQPRVPLAFKILLVSPRHPNLPRHRSRTSKFPKNHA